MEDFQQQLLDLNYKIQIIEYQNKELREEIRELREELKEIKGSQPRQEKYYQKFLEKEVSGSHQVTKHGVTDVSTENMHIEIKQWKHYKHCLRQLKSYNHGDNKKLVAALYSECKAKKHIIELFHDHNIEVWELKDTDTSVEIVKHEVKRDNFERWLDENIVENQDSVINLKDVCYLYYQRELSNKEKIRVKKDVEKWIHITFPHIDYLCKESRLNNVKYNGWKGVKLRE